MEFNPDGGIFLLEMPSLGEEYSVEVPWAVAADGIGSAAGGSSPDEDALKSWLQDNEEHFSAMAASRLDPETFPPAGEDDERVLAAQTLRHI